MNEWKTYTEIIEEYEKALESVRAAKDKYGMFTNQRSSLMSQEDELIQAIAAMRPYAEREQAQKEEW
jgi:hypothetical protein